MTRYRSAHQTLDRSNIDDGHTVGGGAPAQPPLSGPMRDGIVIEEEVSVADGVLGDSGVTLPSGGTSLMIPSIDDSNSKFVVPSIDDNNADPGKFVLTPDMIGGGDGGTGFFLTEDMLHDGGNDNTGFLLNPTDINIQVDD